jgi:predicted nucleic acid-binding protein
MSTFLDTNILIYLLDQRDRLHVWTEQQLEKCKIAGPAIISDIVYCEFSVGMANQAAVDAAVSRLGLERIRGSDAALFRASQAFKCYRTQHKGQKTNVLPDFIIGAIAEVVGAPLVTNNSTDFVKYFPKIKLISP